MLRVRNGVSLDLGQAENAENSNMKETESDNRKKAFHAKARTGCLTCRKRRVKCDENRPACGRCRKGNRQCEGYIDTSLSKAETSPQMKLTWLQPTTYQSREDADRLASFLHRTSPYLSFFSGGNDLWTVLVPQASWKYPEVRTMLHAMSLIDRYMASSQTSSLMLEGDYAKSITYYNKALQNLSSTTPDLENILLSALLAWLFETIRCNTDAANMHFSSAQCILQDYKRKNKMLITPEMEVVFNAVEGSEWDLHYQEILSWQQTWPDLNHCSEIGSVTDAYRALDPIMDLLSRRPLNNTIIDMAQRRIEAWRASFDAYKYKPDTEALTEKRPVFLLHNILLVLIDIERRTLTGLTSTKQSSCVIKDAEKLIDFPDLDGFRTGLDMLLSSIIEQSANNAEQLTRSKRLLARLQKSV